VLAITGCNKRRQLTSVSALIPQRCSLHPAATAVLECPHVCRLTLANCPFINPIKPLFSCHSNLTHCTINAHITTISVTLMAAINVETIHCITIQLLHMHLTICTNDVSPLSRCLRVTTIHCVIANLSLRYLMCCHTGHNVHR